MWKVDRRVWVGSRQVRAIAAYGRACLESGGSVDYAIRAHQERVRQRETLRLGGLQVHDQLELDVHCGHLALSAPPMNSENSCGVVGLTER